MRTIAGMLLCSIAITAVALGAAAFTYWLLSKGKNGPGR